MKEFTCLEYICMHMYIYIYIERERERAVDIATPYGLDDRGSNPDGCKSFRTRPDRPWGPPSLLYNGYCVHPEGKAARAWRWTLTPPAAEVKERVKLNLYTPSMPSWHVVGWALLIYVYVYWRLFRAILIAGMNSLEQIFLSGYL